MKNSTYKIIYAVIILLILALVFLSFLSAGTPYKNTLLALPKDGSPFSLDLITLEKMNGNGLFVTYTSEESGSIKSNAHNYPINIISTNSSFVAVNSFNLLSGSFFTKDALENKSRHIVLNKAGAYELFGSVNIVGQQVEIEGDLWQIVGVINDASGEKTSSGNAYIPSSHKTPQPKVVLASLGTTGKPAESYTITQLKKIGLTSANADFISLEKLRGNSLAMLVKVIQTLLLSIILKLGLSSVSRLYSYYNKQVLSLEQLYFKDILKQNRKDAPKLLLWALLAVCSVCALLYYLTTLLNFILVANDYFPSLESFPLWNISGGTGAIQRYFLASNAIVFLLTLLFAILIIGFVSKNLKALRN